MPFPYVEEDCFENGGTVGTESDTGSLLDFPHYSTLAKTPGLPMPFRGAYLMRIQPGDTNDHTITYPDVNISADALGWSRFYVWHAITATADDIFNIYEIQAGGTVEGAISLQVTASSGLVEIGIGETAASSFGCALTPNEWHCVELYINVDNAGNDDGVLTLYVDGHSVQTVSSLDQGAITDAVLGTQGTLATTTGAIYFDQYVHDEDRVGPIRDRWPETQELTITHHVALGPGELDCAQLTAGAGADCVLELYDADEVIQSSGNSGTVLVPGTLIGRLQNSVASDMAPTHIGRRNFHRGLYAVLSGTNPRATVKLCKATGWGSEGAVRSWARDRKAPQLGA